MKYFTALSRGRRSLADLDWASREFGCSRRQVASWLLYLRWHHDYRPAAAHREGLSNPALGRHRLTAVISKRRLLALQAVLNPASHIGMTEDKAVFYAYARALGLPVPRLFGVVDRPVGWAEDGNPLRSATDWEGFLTALDGDFLVKPAAGVYGRGIRAFTRVADGFQEYNSNAVITPRSLADSLLSDPWRRLVVQQRVRNHPEIETLTGSPTLQTVRIRTLLTGTGDVFLGSAKIKIAVGGHICDNISAGATGNFVAAIGRDDGRLRLPHAYGKSGRGVVPVPRHPRSGRALEGFAVPFWEELKELARKAAILFTPLRTIGWDIAVTGTGPVLIEANRWWDPGNESVVLPAEETYPSEMSSLLSAMRAEARTLS